MACLNCQNNYRLVSLVLLNRSEQFDTIFSFKSRISLTMKAIWKLLLVFYVLLSSLVICHCSSKKSIDAHISYHKEFCFNKILVQFHENEKLVLDVSKIKYFFMFTNNFYCENVKVNDTPLPLFFIASTKKNFFSLMLFLLKVEQNHVENVIQEAFYLSQSKNDILNLKTICKSLSHMPIQ